MVVLSSLSCLGTGKGAVDATEGNASDVVTTATVAIETSQGVTSEPTMDLGGIPTNCDLWMDDCPAGLKCMPFAAPMGLMWSGSHCSPVSPQPKEEGEPCSIENYLMSGVDDCGEGLICWYVDDSLHGECVSMCVGSEEMPECLDALVSCAIDSTGFLHLCWGCSPLLQDCWSPFENCVPSDLTKGFQCTAEGAAGPGEPCANLNDCKKGTFCSSNSGFCPGNSCCVQYCALDSMMNDCPDMAKCVPFFQEPVSMKYVDIGFCSP